MSSMTEDTASENVLAAVTAVERSMVDLTPEDIPAEAVQRLMVTAVAAYFAARDAGLDFGPFPAGADVSATAAMVAAANILQAAEIEVFELGMWKTLTGA